MASGINSTFRQVGIATGVAALGSVLAARLKDNVLDALSSGPLANQAGGIAEKVADGRTGEALAAVDPQFRGLAARAAAESYSNALDTVLLIGSAVALAVAVATVLLIRQRDFVAAAAGAELVPAA